jgi:predicted amidophosphoribosyltransferase
VGRETSGGRDEGFIAEAEGFLRLPSLGTDLLDLFLPRGCVSCGERIPPEEEVGLVCVRCRTLLRRPPPPRCPRCDVPQGTGREAGAPCLECAHWPDILSWARAAVAMEPPADGLVHALKYGGWRTLGDVMGQRMVKVLPPTLDVPLVVPVPTTLHRKRMRGYNQARVLAEVVAGQIGACLEDALSRPKGGTQVRMGPRERSANVRGAFRVLPDSASRIEGREVILIDDVLTTGATALSAVSALAEAGPRSVGLLTFARALPFGTSQGRDRRN